MTRITAGLILAILAVASPREAHALITGDVGNKPVRDPGWPTGASAIFNHTGRVAWWEGPPFGGGQWHAECRGDAKALNAVLANFARMDAKTKRIVVHDGTGYSFWLAPNREPKKLATARIDWVFMVWQPSSWERLRKMPADLNPTDPGDASPPSQIDVYTTDLRWADVIVPKGIEVIDNRLVAHGFKTSDGVVIEGKVTDLSTKKPIAATMRLEKIEPRPTGGYNYPTLAEAKADAAGHWVLKGAPAEWVRVIVEAPGYVSRVVGHARYDGQPLWQTFDAALAHAAPVSGQVVDEDGKPLADVDVRLDNVQPESGGRYESPLDYKVKTGADGRFRVEQVPPGKCSVWVHKPGYVRPGLGLPIAMPKADVEMKMIKAASIHVSVEFEGKRPGGYMVQISPEGGDVVGSYGGSGNIDVANQISFKNMPPGRYILRGRPNPGSDDEETDPVTVDLTGGHTFEVKLKAKLK